VQRGLIVGASGSGKTTLLQWLVNRRRQTSKVVVIDPHGWPDKWPGCYVVGAGRNYPEIDRALFGLLQLMDKRYTEIGNGTARESTHPPIVILIDEWRAIVANLGKPAAETIKALLTESRKAAFTVFVVSHSDRAKPLGLEGEYDLKDGFAMVRLALINGQRQATIDTGSGPQPALLPGILPTAFTHYAPPDFELDLTPKPSAQEQEILELHAQGMSLREISQAVYGEGKFGKHWNDKIKQTLDNFGVSSE
jgi:GTPase SAR1 family protein